MWLPLCLGSLQMSFPCVWMFMIGFRSVLSGYVMLNVDWLKLFTRAALTTMFKKFFFSKTQSSFICVLVLVVRVLWEWVNCDVFLCMC